MGCAHGFNIGIRCGKFGDDRHLTVIDVDNKNGKCGDDTLAMLEMEGFEIPEDYVVLTPTGGRHIYLLTDTPMQNGVNVLGDGVDIRGQGGYVVAPGSVVAAGTYVVSA